MKRGGNSRQAKALLFVAFAFCAVILGLLVLQKYENSRLKPIHPPDVEETGMMLVTLFFASPDGDLVREGREIDECAELTECAETVVEELINGPVGESLPTLPSVAAVHSVSLDGDTAVVDVATAFTEGLSGSQAEMVAFYSVVNSLAVNFPRIKNVQFLFEGQKLESLGHLDLSAPLSPDFTLEKN